MSGEPGRYAIALAVSNHLMSRGALGVAVTGSLARGDDAPGSDVDLWVLGRKNERVHFEVHGVQVTCLCENVRKVFSLEHLGRVEVASMKVLSDPHHVFERVAALHHAHRRAIRENTLAALRRVRDALAASSERGPLVARLLFAREALFFSVLVAVFSEHGLRSPKFRHVQRLRGRRFAAAYGQAMGFTDADGAPRLRRAVAALLGRRSAGNTLPKLAAQAWEEGHQLARSEVLAHLVGRRGPLDQPRALAQLLARSPPKRRAHLATVFSIPSTEAEVTAAVEQVHRLLAAPRGRGRRRGE